MGPHFDSYANSGIPEITGTEHQPFSGRGKEKRPDLLHLLPHLRPNDVGLNALTRIRDLQQLATAIQESTGRRPASHPNHSTTYRLSQLNAKLLQQERQLLGNRAKNIIHILCTTDLADTLLDRGYTPSAKDYLGYGAETPVFTGEDNWGVLRRTESGWHDGLGVIGQVCKSWHTVTQKRRSNPSHITISQERENGGRAYWEIQSSYRTYTKLHSVHLGKWVLQNKTQAHDLVNILYDRVPTLKKAASGKDISNAGIGIAGQHTTSYPATWSAHDWSKGLPVLNAGLPPSHRNPRPRGMRANCTSQPSDAGIPPKETTPRERRAPNRSSAASLHPDF